MQRRTFLHSTLAAVLPALPIRRSGNCGLSSDAKRKVAGALEIVHRRQRETIAALSRTLKA